jgi:hypothetical protein
VTLSIVSRNSLSSDWVALESVESFAAERYLEEERFIACYLDEGFFEDSFLGQALGSLQQQIDDLDEEILKLMKGSDPVHLQTKRTRKINLKNNLPRILERLLGSLTLDIRKPAYETSMQRIIKEICKLPNGNSSPRKKEIAYLDKLRDEELKELNTYTKLGGQVTEKLIIKPVYELKAGERLNVRDRISKPVETRRFEDAVGEILQLK